MNMLDRLSASPPPRASIGDGWMLALVTAGCVVVVGLVAVG